MANRLVVAALEDLTRHAHKLNSIVTMKGFEWKSLRTQPSFQSFLASLENHKDSLLANPTVPLTEIENYHEHYRKDGVAVLEMGFKKGVSYPLHDHPEMVVISLVLSGKVRFTRLDVDLENFHSSGVKKVGLLSSLLPSGRSSLLSRPYPQFQVGQK